MLAEGKITGQERKNYRLFFLGILSLLIGTSFYFFLRSSDSNYLLIYFRTLSHPNNFVMRFIGNFGGSIPSFFHVLSLSLLNISLLSKTRVQTIIICIQWFLFGTIFELAQKYNSPINSNFFSILQENILFEKFEQYFIFGTFDFFDLLATALGAMTAFLIAEIGIFWLHGVKDKNNLK